MNYSPDGNLLVVPTGIHKPPHTNNSKPSASDKEVGAHNTNNATAIATITSTTTTNTTTTTATTTTAATNNVVEVVKPSLLSEYTTLAQQRTFCTHVFSRHHYSNPCISLIGLEEASVAVRFCPRLFKPNDYSTTKGNAQYSMIPGDYKLVFAQLRFVVFVC